MKLRQTSTNKTVIEELETSQSLQAGLKTKATIGQRLADSMTAHIGSWAFLTVQSGVLAVWITLNSIPGIPHWDENPFILLNLVFSFASAYTAPVVLMSQNRQSEVERKNAEVDHKVNVKAGQDIELLHTKLDSLQEHLTQKKQPLKETQTSDLMLLLDFYKHGNFPNHLSAPKSLNASQPEDNA